MTEKAKIVEDLGEAAVLLPERVNHGLVANDRVKYFFALLQAARDHAEQPESAPGDLRPERLASQVPSPEFDLVIPGSSRMAPDGYAIPLAGRIRAEILDAIDAMVVPAELAAKAGLGPVEDAAEFRRRLTSLNEALPAIDGEAVPAAFIAAATAGLREHGDSLHVLVMDLHKALNRLQASIARETIAGAQVYGLGHDDRGRVAAFMRGIARTAPLKLDHPGLGTTATRAGARLVIQNDIGTTDAHVLVISVEDRTATVTCTDVHLRRLRFFADLLKPFEVHWDDTVARSARHLDSGTYYLAIGSFTAADGTELDRYLEHLGSRLVFLIDWNRARKRLIRFVEPADAIAILTWAAQEEVGHRPFLALGGEQLVYEAIEYAAKVRLPYGQPLHEVLGRDPTVEYLQFVLRTASEGLLAGRSDRLIRDEIKAELLRYFETAQESLIALAARHAELVFEIASGVRDGLLRATEPDGIAVLERNAERAARWESRADRLVEQVRTTVHAGTGSAWFQMFLEEADDAADGLEEAAFLLTLLPAWLPATALLDPLRHMAELLLEAAQDYVKCLAGAPHVRRGGAREDLEDFLRAVDRVVTIEHLTDTAVRTVTAALIRGAGDFRELHLGSSIARTLEESSDALSRSALMLRARILDEMSGA